MKHSKILIIVVLLLAAVIRLWGISDKGIFFQDEAVHLSEVKFVRYALSAFNDVFRGKLDIGVLKENMPGFFGTGKILHVFFITLFSFIFKNYEHAAIISSTVFGTLTVYLVYLFGRRFFNEETGIWSAYLLAVLPYHIYYSRTALAITDSVFIFLLSLYFYLIYRLEYKNRYIYYIWSAFLAGMSYLANNGWFWIPLIYIVYEFYLWLKSPKERKFKGFKDTVVFMFFMAMPLLLAQVIFLAPKWITMAKGINISYNLDYFLQTFAKIGFSGHQPRFEFNFLNWFVYFKYIMQFDGLIFLLLSVSALILVFYKFIKERSLRYFVLNLQFGIFAIFLGMVVFNGHYPRYFSMSLPFMCMATGVTIAQFIGFISGLRKKQVRILLGIVILLGVLPYIVNIINLKSHREVVLRKFLNNYSGRNISVYAYEGFVPIWEYYYDIPVNINVIRHNEIDIEKADYVIVDPYTVYYMDFKTLENLKNIMRQNSPAASSENNWAIFEPMMIETGIVPVDNFNACQWKYKYFKEGKYNFLNKFEVYEIEENE